jgi:hypothetical protein
MTDELAEWERSVECAAASITLQSADLRSLVERCRQLEAALERIATGTWNRCPERFTTFNVRQFARKALSADKEAGS